MMRVFFAAVLTLAVILIVLATFDPALRDWLLGLLPPAVGLPKPDADAFGHASD